MARDVVRAAGTAKVPPAVVAAVVVAVVGAEIIAAASAVAAATGSTMTDGNARGSAWAADGAIDNCVLTAGLTDGARANGLDFRDTTRVADTDGRAAVAATVTASTGRPTPLGVGGAIGTAGFMDGARANGLGFDDCLLFSDTTEATDAAAVGLPLTANLFKATLSLSRSTLDCCDSESAEELAWVMTGAATFEAALSTR